MAQPEPLQVQQPQEPLSPKQAFIDKQKQDELNKQLAERSKPQIDPEQQRKLLEKVVEQQEQERILARMTWADSMLGTLNYVLDNPPPSTLYDRDQLFSLKNSIQDDYYKNLTKAIDYVVPQQYKDFGIGKRVASSWRKGDTTGDWSEFDNYLDRYMTYSIDQLSPESRDQVKKTYLEAKTQLLEQRKQDKKQFNEEQQQRKEFEKVIRDREKKEKNSNK
jgi:hypothetical protein